MKSLPVIDMIEINRIKNSLENPRFLTKVYGKNEISLFSKKNMPIQSIAANFAAKEAFLKACGVGLGYFDLSEIEILRRETGQPYIKLSGKAKAETLHLSFTVSLTHTRNYAAAIVIAQPIE